MAKLRFWAECYWRHNLSELGLVAIDLPPPLLNGCLPTDVYAPGTDITSTVPNNCYEVMSGTSMATPIVARETDGS